MIASIGGLRISDLIVGYKSHLDDVAKACLERLSGGPIITGVLTPKAAENSFQSVAGTAHSEPGAIAFRETIPVGPVCFRLITPSLDPGDEHTRCEILWPYGRERHPTKSILRG